MNASKTATGLPLGLGLIVARHWLVAGSAR